MKILDNRNIYDWGSTSVLDILNILDHENIKTVDQLKEYDYHLFEALQYFMELKEDSL